MGTLTLAGEIGRKPVEMTQLCVGPLLRGPVSNGQKFLPLGRPSSLLRTKFGPILVGCPGNNVVVY